MRMKAKDRYREVYCLYYGNSVEGKELEIECFRSKNAAVERRNTLIKEHGGNVPSSAGDFNRIEVISNDWTPDWVIKINRESVVCDGNLTDSVWVIRTIYNHISDNPAYNETVYAVFGTFELAKSTINERRRILSQNHPAFKDVDYDDSHYGVVNDGGGEVVEFKIKEVCLL